MQDDSRFEQRERYKTLLYQIKTNQTSRYRANRSELASYPLYPYLEYQYMIHRLSRQDLASIQGFIQQYGDTPLANQLKQNWLYSLGKRGRWQTFMESDPGPISLTKENACFDAYATWKSGDELAGFQKAEKLWLVPFSQPDECDAIFKVWRDADGLTPTLAWQRYELAIKKNEITLSNYLERFLDANDKASASRLKRYHTRPRRMSTESNLGPDDQRGRDIVAHGIYRLARRDAPLAYETLNNIVSKYSFSEDTLKHLYLQIGTRLARKPETLALLETLPIDITAHEDLVSAQLRTHIKSLNWPTALVYINLLPAEQQATSRWQYWRGRILLQSGGLEDHEIGKSVFAELAKERSFYGFLAADALNQQYNFEDQPEAITQEQVFSLEESPGIQRAFELYTLNEKTRARREWSFTTRDFSNIELRIAARVAERWGWHEQAVRSMIRAKAWDDLSPRFPLAYQDTFRTGARQEDIPMTFNIAIARQESAFMTDAQSPVGAMGLMQLMPATAKQVAKQRNISLRNNHELTNPNLNIRLGSAYLGDMYRRFNNNRILASAAYNAGPNRVSRWIDSSLPLDVWIETIPFKETRNYVQNVLVFSSIYSRQLNQNSPLIYDHEKQDFSASELTNLTTQNLDSPNI